MTVNAQVPWVIYLADGLQTTFPYDFFLKQASDLFVYWQDMLLPPGGYTVTGVGQPEGGNVVFPQPLPAGELILRRATPQNQLTDYVEGDAFPAASHEQGLDRLTVLVQDLNERLSRVSTLGVTTGTAHRHLVLPDPLANTVLGWDSAAAQWTLYPFGVTQIPVDPVSGIGWGKNTIEVRPVAGAGQASGLLFPAGVLGLAVSVWVEASLGTSQGLTQVGIGTALQPDRWGYLAALTAATETSAGIFEGYSGQPMLSGGMITLTAYGGRFDGSGVLYVTGHFATFSASHAVGYSYTPGSPEESQPLPPVHVPLASDLEPGIVELLDATEVLADTDLTRALTIGRLVSRTGTPTRLGLLRTATPAAVVTGTNDTDAATPLGVAQALAPVVAVNTTQASQIAALTAKVPTGTPLSVVRYAASGTTLETGSPTVVIDASGRLGVGQATPLTPLHVVGELRVEAGFVRCNREGANAAVILEASGDAVSSVYGGLTLSRARGTTASRTAVQAGDRLALLTFQGWATSFGAGAQVEVVAEDTFSASARGSRLTLSTADLGTITLTERLRLDSAGRIGLHTTLSATLGSGASYAPLTVKGGTLVVAQSSTQERPQALLAPSWVVSTDATRTARLALSVYDATAAREGLRLEADGSAARLGFYGGAAVAKPTVSGAKGGNAALGSLLTALSSLGLVTDSSAA